MRKAGEMYIKSLNELKNLENDWETETLTAVLFWLGANVWVFMEFFPESTL